MRALAYPVKLMMISLRLQPLPLGLGCQERLSTRSIFNFQSDKILTKYIILVVTYFQLSLQIPNSPIVFADDPDQRERTEDEIVAYTWHTYLENLDDPEQNVYMAMARGAVRAMDAVSEFTGELLGSSVEQFITYGRSKRGWTTWLTGAMANDRVRAIIPSVWDGINLSDVFHSQWRNYGGWSFAIEDYVENHIMEHLDTPEMLELQNLIDPFFYRTRLTMPKLVCTGLMDEFQMPDDETYWWDEMPAEGVEGSSEIHGGNTKWLLKMPNNGHGLDNGQETLVPVIGTFITYILNDWDIPYITWDFDEASGDVTVYTHGGDVYSAQMWYATSCTNEKRDFRVLSLDDPCTCGGPVVDDEYCPAINAIWVEEPLQPNEDGSYTGHMDPPADGHWGAFVVSIQMTTDDLNRDDPMHTFFTRRDTELDLHPQPRFPVVPPGVFEFMSMGSVVPNTYPFDDCTMDGCEGELV